MHLSIDLALLRADLADLSARTKTLKQLLRRRWLAPMAEQQRELCLLKRRVTSLCALGALSRGKLHFRNKPPGHHQCDEPARCHARIAERLAPAYTRAVSTEVSA